MTDLYREYIFNSNSHKHPLGLLPLAFGQPIENDIPAHLLILHLSFLVILVILCIGGPVAHGLPSLDSLIELRLLLFQVG
jgi:hypothetical protein